MRICFENQLQEDEFFRRSRMRRACGFRLSRNDQCAKLICVKLSTLPLPTAFSKSLFVSVCSVTRRGNDFRLQYGIQFGKRLFHILAPKAMERIPNSVDIRAVVAPVVLRDMADTPVRRAEIERPPICTKQSAGCS